MFVSKLWFFLVAVIAALALSIALTLPRPAQRVQTNEVEPDKVGAALSGVQLLLKENARNWVDLAAVVARAPGAAGQPPLAKTLEAASAADEITAPVHDAAKGTLQFALSQIGGAQKPEWVIALDDGGRVVARVGLDEKFEKIWGDDISGYFIIRDVLRGYLRDDLWLQDGKLYRVAASPVFTPNADGRPKYVGAVVLGDQIDLDLVKALESRVGHCQKSGDADVCDTHVAFFVGDETIASSDNTLVGKDVLEAWHKAATTAGDGKSVPPFTVKAGGKDVIVTVRPLPGEVAAQNGFIAVYAPRSAAVGFMATLHGVTKDDLGGGHFPWVPIIVGFMVVTLVGLALMWMEADKPLRRLMVDAVALGKGDAQKLAEEKHKGRFGSIARSVNIAIEKLQREARDRRKDLGAVLGPPPEAGGLGGGLGGSSPFATPRPGSAASPFSQPAPQPAPFRFESDPPMHLPPTGAPPGKAVEPIMPAGAGFAFDMAPPLAPTTKPPAPPVTARSGAMPPPSLPEPRSTAGKAPPPRPPPGPPPPLPPPLELPAKAAPRSPTRAMPAPPPPMLASLDDDILAGGLEVDASTPMPLPMPMPMPQSTSDFGGETVVATPSQELIRATADGDAAYFREIYDDFVELKRKCGESLEGLTYDKFAAKLRGNRDQLVKKYGCRSVQFQVYVKDGKAALKATPVKA